MANYDLGILGGGQLARMSVQAAQRMGLRCLTLDPGEDSPASQIAASRVGSLSDPDAIAGILADCDYVTLENEFIPANAITKAVERTAFDLDRLIPGVDALANIQDKLRQRRAYAQADVPSPLAVAIQTGEEVDVLGFPCVLKARFGGYDGKGVRFVHSREEFEALRPVWSDGNWLAEAMVPFVRELAQMVAITPTQTVVFPTVETVQADHVCDLTFPSDQDTTEIAIAAARAVGSVGLFGVELFQLATGAILVNEIAPRPHNTGHYTLDGGGVSQFEIHVRVAMGLPLPPVETMVPTVMANLLGQPGAGDFRDGLRAALTANPKAKVHWYGKASSKPGRKMGHLNLPGGTQDEARAARAAFYAGWTSQ
jgi:5-(carboxyamino)imidazole ribonucleotide synthase